MTPLKETVTTSYGHVLAPSEHRRRGYGTTMLAHVVDVAREHGRTRMVASSQVGSR